MTVADATPDFGKATNDRAFIGHPRASLPGSSKGATFYYSMQTLLTLYGQLSVDPGADGRVMALDWLRSWHYTGLEGQPSPGNLRRLHQPRLPNANHRDHRRPIRGPEGCPAGGRPDAVSAFKMAIERVRVRLACADHRRRLFKGNIASQVGALYKENDLRRAMAFQIFYIAINVSVIIHR